MSKALWGLKHWQKERDRLVLLNKDSLTNYVLDLRAQVSALSYARDQSDYLLLYHINVHRLCKKHTRLTLLRISCLIGLIIVNEIIISV